MAQELVVVSSSEDSAPPTREKIVEVLGPLVAHDAIAGQLMMLTFLAVLGGGVAALSEGFEPYSVWQASYALYIVSVVLLQGVRPRVRRFADIPWSSLPALSVYVAMQWLLMAPRSSGLAAGTFCFFNLVGVLLSAVSGEERARRYAVADFQASFPEGSVHRARALELVRALPTGPTGVLSSAMHGKVLAELSIALTAPPVEQALAEIPAAAPSISAAPPVPAPPAEAAPRPVTAAPAPATAAAAPATVPAPAPPAARAYLAPMPIDPFEGPPESGTDRRRD